MFSNKTITNLSIKSNSFKSHNNSASCKKKIYKQYSRNIVGIDIAPELPRSPDIIINNDFKKSINQLSMDLLKKINKLLKGRK